MFVADGSVDIKRSSQDGKEVIISRLKIGDFFGEIALVLSQTRTATIRAKTHCDLFALERADFNRVLKDHPQRARQIAETAQQRYQVIMKVAPQPGQA